MTNFKDAHARISSIYKEFTYKLLVNVRIVNIEIIYNLLVNIN